jgi:hypothetical protein
MRVYQQVEHRLCSVGLLLALCGTGWAQERPLPEVAREKSGKAASRVFTNEDLERGRPAETPSAAPAASPNPAAAEGSKSRITVPGLLEEGTLSRAREILESLRRDEQVLLRRYAQIEQKLSAETDAHLRQLYSNSLARREETLARKRLQIQQVEKAIEAAERTPAPRSKHEPAPKPEK